MKIYLTYLIQFLITKMVGFKTSSILTYFISQRVLPSLDDLSMKTIKGG